MEWLLLALASAVSLSLTDLFVKKALRALPLALVAWVRLAMPVPVLLLAVGVGGWAAPRSGFWWAFAAAVPVELLATLLYQRALQLSPLGLTAPYLALTPAFLLVTGRWILGEVPDPLAYPGVALVTAGGYWLQTPRGHGVWGPLRGLVHERGSLLMVGVALLYSITAALGKVAVTHSSPQVFSLLYFAVLSVLLGPWAWRARTIPGPDKGSRGWALLPVGVFGASMILFHLHAIQLVPASYMISVKRTSLLWSILLGRLVLGEEALGRRLVAGGLMLVGVALIAGAG